MIRVIPVGAGDLGSAPTPSALGSHFARTSTNAVGKMVAGMVVNLPDALIEECRPSLPSHSLAALARSARAGPWSSTQGVPEEFGLHHWGLRPQTPGLVCGNTGTDARRVATLL